jgi:hypothetical protein
MRSAGGARRTVSLVALVALVLLPGCRYRLAGIAPLGEDVRIEVAVNQGRLVRLQGYLQDEVATALEQKLGWRVRATGSARLALVIDEEHIDASGSDARGIATRWTITTSGQALLTSRRGHAQTPWTGTGYTSSLGDEPEALRQAARNAAELIAVWLENEAGRWAGPR